VIPDRLVRSRPEERDAQIAGLREFQVRNRDRVESVLRRLQEIATGGGNLFAELMETVKVASLGQITHALYEVGGRYRRNM
jgi:methylmalonyl-CoA mutase